MFTVYVLRNTCSGRHYIGATGDLTRRMNEHNLGQTRSTRKQGEWELVYSEEFKTYSEAHQRELVIKSYKGGNAFKKLIARA